MNMPMTDALGTSEIFLGFQEKTGRLAVTERPVLVLGERGTGKELAAQRLHYLSARWEKPLITVLCPALSSTLLESELFGHEAGSFTGARGRKAGYFERADGGTLFLDEVADMPLPLQDKLLRVIEYGVFERVGGVTSVRVDVRVVAATNRDLPELTRQGHFRADLLDRLAFDVLYVPPLRVRGEDKLLLARHFASGMAAELGLNFAMEQTTSSSGSSLDIGFGRWGPDFGDEALEQLKNYAWPGNVRELKNVVERTVARRGSTHLTQLDINPFESPYAMSAPLVTPEPGGTVLSCLPVPPPEPEDGLSLRAKIQKLEKESLRSALEQTRYRQTEAARLLGMTYHQFRALYRKYQMEK